jgi:hypothetical protein
LLPSAEAVAVLALGQSLQRFGLLAYLLNPGQFGEQRTGLLDALPKPDKVLLGA